MIGTAYNTIMNIYEIIALTLYVSKRKTRVMKNKTLVKQKHLYLSFRTVLGLLRKMFWRKEPCVMKVLKHSPSLSSCQDHGGTTKKQNRSLSQADLKYTAITHWWFLYRNSRLRLIVNYTWTNLFPTGVLLATCTEKETLYLYYSI